jgi:hypothetical protein
MMIGQDMGDPGITNGAFGSATETSLDMAMGKFKKCRVFLLLRQ